MGERVEERMWERECGRERGRVRVLERECLGESVWE